MLPQFRPAFVGLTLSALLVVSPRPVSGAPGDLMTNFDQDGRLTLDLASNLFDMGSDALVLLDGSIVTAGTVQVGSSDYDFAVAKIRPDGTLDSTFASSGVATVHFDLGGGEADLATRIVRSGSGFLVAGYAEAAADRDYDLAIARLTSSGHLDTTFGNGGRTTVAIDLGGTNFESVSEILVQNDGRIVLAGTIEGPQHNSDFLAVRLTSQGALDTSFGTQGFTTVAFDIGGQHRDDCVAADLQSNGSIVLMGTAERSGLNFDFAVARLTAHGVLDSTFGNGGRAAVGFERGGSHQDFARDGLVDGADRIVIVGNSSAGTTSSNDFAIARLTSNGAADATFGGNGRTTIAIDRQLGADLATAVALAPHGQLVVGGDAYYTQADSDFALVRLDSNGALDASFGSGGTVLVPFDLTGARIDALRDVTIGIDGGIVAVGRAQRDHSNHDLALAKVEGSSWFQP